MVCRGGKGEDVEAKAGRRGGLPQWMRGRLDKIGLGIGADALALFAERVGSNLLAARQEISKLAAVSKGIRQYR